MLTGRNFTGYDYLGDVHSQGDTYVFLAHTVLYHLYRHLSRSNLNKNKKYVNFTGYGYHGDVSNWGATPATETQSQYVR